VLARKSAEPHLGQTINFPVVSSFGFWVMQELDRRAKALQPDAALRWGLVSAFQSLHVHSIAMEGWEVPTKQEPRVRLA
jgi:hypothetical protein